MGKIFKLGVYGLSLGVWALENQGAGNSGYPPSRPSVFAIRLLAGVVVVLLVASVILGALLYSYTAEYAKVKSEYTRLEEEVTGSPPSVLPLLSVSGVDGALGLNTSVSWQRISLNGSNRYGSVNQVILSSVSPNFPAFILLAVYGYPSPIYAKQNYYSSLLYVSGHTQYNVTGTLSGWNYTYYANGTSTNFNYVYLAAYSGSLVVNIEFQNINPTVASQGISGKQLLSLLSSQIGLL